MHFNKKRVISIAVLVAATVANSLCANDVNAIAELKYSAANGKATSYLDSASNTTYAPHFSAGVLFGEYNTRALINYKPIRWRDADADLVSLSLDYIYKANKDLDLYAGAGIGSMSYKAQGMKDTKRVYTLQAGVNYSIHENIYAIAGINYLNTNDLGIQKNQYIYSDVENMLSAEIGLGFRFGSSK